MSDPLLDTYGGFHVGLKVQLQFSSTAPRLSSIIIGYRQGQYIIASRPKSQNLIGFTDSYLDEAHVLVRYRLNKSIFGFRSQISHITKFPDRLVFLHYPTSVEQFSLRQSKRVDCFFSGTIQVGRLIQALTLVDISYEGCRGMVSTIQSKLTEQLLSNQKLNATVNFVFAKDVPIELPCAVMRVVKEKQNLLVGLKFRGITPKLSHRIHQYIDMVE